jgi:hypothetical protein
VKDIDFLPEWYKEGYRRRVHMRRQYAVLVGIVCAMISYNLIATHRIDAIAGTIDSLDNQRHVAEQIIHEYDTLNRQLSVRQAKVDLIGQVDSKFNLGAVLAELSHIISGRVALSRIEFTSEAVSGAIKEQSPVGSAVRPAGGVSGSGKSVLLGDVCLRIVLAGVAANPADVGTLACRLEESPYFTQVHPSLSRSSKIEVPTSSPTPTGQAKEAFQVSEFEITCYLANYEDVEGK